MTKYSKREKLNAYSQSQSIRNSYVNGESKYFHDDGTELVQRCLIIRKDHKGYGLTVSGDNPVYVQSVRRDGAAQKAGVFEGDRIIKVNGKIVTHANHLEVVRLIKAASYVALTVLGKPAPLNFIPEYAASFDNIQLGQGDIVVTSSPGSQLCLERSGTAVKHHEHVNYTNYRPSNNAQFPPTNVQAANNRNTSSRIPVKPTATTSSVDLLSNNPTSPVNNFHDKIPSSSCKSSIPVTPLTTCLSSTPTELKLAPKQQEIYEKIVTLKKLFNQEALIHKNLQKQYLYHPSYKLKQEIKGVTHRLSSLNENIQALSHKMLTASVIIPNQSTNANSNFIPGLSGSSSQERQHVKKLPKRVSSFEEYDAYDSLARKATLQRATTTDQICLKNLSTYDALNDMTTPSLTSSPSGSHPFKRQNTVIGTMPIPEEEGDDSDPSNRQDYLNAVDTQTTEQIKSVVPRDLIDWEDDDDNYQEGQGGQDNESQTRLKGSYNQSTSSHQPYHPSNDTISSSYTTTTITSNIPSSDRVQSNTKYQPAHTRSTDSISSLLQENSTQISGLGNSKLDRYYFQDNKLLPSGDLPRTPDRGSCEKINTLYESFNTDDNHLNTNIPCHLNINPNTTSSQTPQEDWPSVIINNNKYSSGPRSSTTTAEAPALPPRTYVPTGMGSIPPRGLSFELSLEEEEEDEDGREVEEFLKNQQIKNQSHHQQYPLNTRQSTVSLSDDDADNFERHGPYIDIHSLKSHSAHLSVFFNYLFCNSDPNSLLFYLITDYYGNHSSNLKDLKRWAYEIHSCFVVPHAPLKIHVSESAIVHIDDILQSLDSLQNETGNKGCDISRLLESLKSIFKPAREQVVADIREKLADFRLKRSLGLSSIYGDNALDQTGYSDRHKTRKLAEQIMYGIIDKLARYWTIPGDGCLNGQTESQNQIDCIRDRDSLLLCATVTVCRTSMNLHFKSCSNVCLFVRPTTSIPPPAPSNINNNINSSNGSDIFTSLDHDTSQQPEPCQVQVPLDKIPLFCCNTFWPRDLASFLPAFNHVHAHNAMPTRFMMRLTSGVVSTRGSTISCNMPHPPSSSAAVGLFGSKPFALSGHSFSATRYTKLTFCNLCHEILGGLGYQGLQCQNCQYNSHRSCLSCIEETCLLIPSHLVTNSLVGDPSLPCYGSPDGNLVAGVVLRKPTSVASSSTFPATALTSTNNTNYNNPTVITTSTGSTSVTSKTAAFVSNIIRRRETKSMFMGGPSPPQHNSASAVGSKSPAITHLAHKPIDIPEGVDEEEGEQHLSTAPITTATLGPPAVSYLQVATTSSLPSRGITTTFQTSSAGLIPSLTTRLFNFTGFGGTNAGNSKDVLPPPNESHLLHSNHQLKQHSNQSRKLSDNGISSIIALIDVDDINQAANNNNNNNVGRSESMKAKGENKYPRKKSETNVPRSKSDIASKALSTEHVVELSIPKPVNLHPVKKKSIDSFNFQIRSRLSDEITKGSSNIPFQPSSATHHSLTSSSLPQHALHYYNRQTHSTTSLLKYVELLNSLEIKDPDLESEPIVPDWQSSCDWDTLKKMKPKEVMRQDVINELFHTERTHVRNLKILNYVFYRPLKFENILPAETLDKLFPNLDQLIKIHGNLNERMKGKKDQNVIVDSVGAMLLDFFGAKSGQCFQEGCATFCKHQPYVLELLKLKQRKDTKLSNFLAEAESNPLCRRLQLKDLLPCEMQRLTKYPLLIENIMKYTVSTESEEYMNLNKAYECAKSILNHVNESIRETQNYRRLMEIESKLDKSLLEKAYEKAHDLARLSEIRGFKLSEKRMVMEGNLQWKCGRNKYIDVHAFLLEDFLLITQKQDDKFVLKFHSTYLGTTVKEDLNKQLSHSPIIRLNNLLTKNVATDKRAFFLVSTVPEGPQLYELIAGTSNERKQWLTHIDKTIEKLKLLSNYAFINSGSSFSTSSSFSHQPLLPQQQSQQPHHLSGSVSFTSSHQIQSIAQPQQPNLLFPPQPLSSPSCNGGGIVHSLSNASGYTRHQQSPNISSPLLESKETIPSTKSDGAKGTVPSNGSNTPIRHASDPTSKSGSISPGCSSQHLSKKYEQRKMSKDDSSMLELRYKDAEFTHKPPEADAYATRELIMMVQEEEKRQLEQAQGERNNELIEYIKTPQIVTPSEIKIRDPIPSRKAEPILTLYEQLRRADRLVQQALTEKRIVSQKILQYMAQQSQKQRHAAATYKSSNYPPTSHKLKRSETIDLITYRKNEKDDGSNKLIDVIDPTTGARVRSPSPLPPLTANSPSHQSETPIEIMYKALEQARSLAKSLNTFEKSYNTCFSSCSTTKVDDGCKAGDTDPNLNSNDTDIYSLENIFELKNPDESVKSCIDREPSSTLTNGLLDTSGAKDLFSMIDLKDDILLISTSINFELSRLFSLMVGLPTSIPSTTSRHTLSATTTSSSQSCVMNVNTPESPSEVINLTRSLLPGVNLSSVNDDDSIDEPGPEREILNVQRSQIIKNTDETSKNIKTLQPSCLGETTQLTALEDSPGDQRQRPQTPQLDVIITGNKEAIHLIDSEAVEKEMLKNVKMNEKPLIANGGPIILRDPTNVLEQKMVREETITQVSTVLMFETKTIT